MKTNRSIIFSIYFTLFCFSVGSVIDPFRFHEVFGTYYPAFDILLLINNIIIWGIGLSAIIVFPIIIWDYYKNKRIPKFSFRACFYSATLYSILQLFLLPVYKQTLDGFESIFFEVLDRLCSSGFEYRGFMEVTYKIIRIVGVSYFLVFDLKEILNKLLIFCKKHVVKVNEISKFLFVAISAAITVIAQINYSYPQAILPYSNRFIYNDFEWTTAFIYLSIIHVACLMVLSYIYSAAWTATNHLVLNKFWSNMRKLFFVAFLMLILEVYLFSVIPSSHNDRQSNPANLLSYSFIINFFMICIGTLIYHKKMFSRRETSSVAAAK